MKKRKKGLVLGLLSVVIIAFILVIGGKMYMKDKNNEKIENQKETALKIKSIISGIEEIKFENDGGRFSGTENDFGKWSIGADVKLSDSSWYTITASKEGIESMKRGFPRDNMQGGTLSTIKVIYSNGESENIK